MLSIDKNQVMIEHYRELTLVIETRIQVTMKSYRITIDGEQLHVLALGKDEILLEGSVQNLAFAYEK